MMAFVVFAAAASAMSTTTKPTVRFTGTGGSDVSAPIEAVAMGRKRPTLMDLADEAGVHIPRSCCAGTCAVCEVKITRGGRERTVRACTATPRDDDVVDVSSGDAELARMMARFEGQDGLDYGRVAPAAPSRPARPPPPREKSSSSSAKTTGSGSLQASSYTGGGGGLAGLDGAAGATRP